MMVIVTTFLAPPLLRLVFKDSENMTTLAKSDLSPKDKL
jgi:hypothetical protein